MVSSALADGSRIGATLGKPHCKGDCYKADRNGGYKVDIIASAIEPLSPPVLPESAAHVGFSDRLWRTFQAHEFSLLLRNRIKRCTMPGAERGDAFIYSGTVHLHWRKSTSYEWLLDSNTFWLCKSFGEVFVGRIEKRCSGWVGGAFRQASIVPPTGYPLGYDRTG